MSVTEAEIERLRKKVEDTDEALQRAAQYGLQLLDDKMDLQNNLEEQRIEMTAVIEGLEQEKYSLQREVELKSRMLDCVHSEFEMVKKQQKYHLEQQQQMLERNHAVELSDFKNKVEKMKADMEAAQLLEKQLKHKLDVQTQALSSTTEELRRMKEHSHDTMSSEILELQVQKMDLESSLAVFKQELQESQYKEQQLQLANTILQRQVEALVDAKEEREKEVVSLYNALEKSRESNQDLQIQLDQVLQQAQDPNSKGNSLFAEVEDKRAEMERQLISMKVQNQSLQKQHAFTKQQMIRMKVQISNLMQLHGSRADPAQLERLHFMLSEKNSEIESLNRKVQQLEKLETNEDQTSTGSCKTVEFVDETYYTDLLKIQLSNSKKVAEELKDELSMARMKALSESQRVLQLERKFFGAENALKQGQSDNVKLQVKLEELQMKYEPHEVNKTRIQKRKREKFPENLPEGKPDQSVDAPALESEPNKISDIAAETLSCSNKNLVVDTVRSAQAPDCSFPLSRENKSVRISEDVPISIPTPPRSSASECSSPTERHVLKQDEERRNWKAERAKKSQAPVHIDPSNTMERQCAQQ
ncbi:protein Spindly [Brachyhypopomus gauderio]|uniref:protein Spindly n=1 Tax=Brachyhypopomus gauderio TaxID=698409 RepID=UPI004042EEDB